VERVVRAADEIVTVATIKMPATRDSMAPEIAEAIEHDRCRHGGSRPQFRLLAATALARLDERIGTSPAILALAVDVPSAFARVAMPQPVVNAD